MICTDLKPIQMSPAGNLILNTVAKIWNLESQSVEEGVAGLTEKGTGAVRSFETFKAIMIVKKHKCVFIKEIIYRATNYEVSPSGHGIPHASCWARST